MANFFFILLIISSYIISTYKVLADQSVEVHIINGLPNNDKPAKIHCASAKDDLGERYPKVCGDFEFHFHVV